MNLDLFRRLSLNGLKYFLYFLFVFFLGRLSFLITFGNFTDLSSYKVGVIEAFIVGARFDVSAICYGFLPVVLLWLISLFLPKRFNIRYSRFYGSFIKYYLIFVLVVFLSLIIIDYFFYQFFQSHINLLFFGIFEDDTTAVLNSVWTDYPIFKILITYVIAIVGLLFVSKRVKKSLARPIIQQSKALSLVLLLLFPLVFVGMRGSVGVFTLRREHTNITANEFVNSLCYNALYSLKFANSERKENRINPDIESELKANGYESLLGVLQHYKGEQLDLFDNNLERKTAYSEFLEQNPPNVIFLQMESMSNHYFDMNSKEFNLIGDLAGQLDDLYYFKNSLSAYNGTIQTLENFILGTPKTIISQSVYFDTPFSSAITLPFKSKGYDTYFLTGASISWRNIDKMLQKQSFDYIEGKNNILESYPGAEEFAWGVHDGYLMDYILDKLKVDDGKPKFIFGLTISNHTPFVVPKSYTTQPIVMPDSLKQKIRVDEQTAYANFYSHQYGAAMLAKLIEEVRNSPLGENTIIAASGDHNIRQVFEYSPEEGFLKRSVPILFYIPEKYKPSNFDQERVSSHKDIFPTLFNLSLSETIYTYTGDNLFGNESKYHFAINDYNFIADSIGAVAIENNQPYYYTWSNSSQKRKLKIDEANSTHAKYMLEKMKSFTTMKTIKIYQDINKAQELKKQL
ncbi:sulfatase-like hydrolase/transferase [Myroides albus]|uniref:Sulfatase-like hydrolase/transferase n=1 Tax=Myroides albus TaxID=2562892 RepID=A0A6I3LM80_9FLAO|nr:alkaline phosphatase family protein [Myroides albus]MTG97681.1 sulfatase-like hydrolase/transferase [Myroides albus]UVD78773.1 sulfatase-like hydrolase/transferase [Myroides albus]